MFLDLDLDLNLRPGPGPGPEPEPNPVLGPGPSPGPGPCPVPAPVLGPDGPGCPEFLHGGGLAGPVVSQEGGDLAAVELEGQSVHSQLVAVAVDLDQVLDVDAGLDVRRLLLDADRWFVAQQSSLHQNNNNQHETQRRRQ